MDANYAQEGENVVPYDDTAALKRKGVSKACVSSLNKVDTPDPWLTFIPDARQRPGVHEAERFAL